MFASQSSIDRKCSAISSSTELVPLPGAPHMPITTQSCIFRRSSSICPKSCSVFSYSLTILPMFASTMPRKKPGLSESLLTPFMLMGIPTNALMAL